MNGKQIDKNHNYSSEWRLLGVDKQVTHIIVTVDYIPYKYINFLL